MYLPGEGATPVSVAVNGGVPDEGEIVGTLTPVGATTERLTAVELPLMRESDTVAEKPWVGPTVIGFGERAMPKSKGGRTVKLVLALCPALSVAVTV